MSLTIGSLQLIDERPEIGSDQRSCARDWNFSGIDSRWLPAATIAYFANAAFLCRPDN
jgi:hypothetical protein